MRKLSYVLLLCAISFSNAHGQGTSLLSCGGVTSTLVASNRTPFAYVGVPYFLDLKSITTGGSGTYSFAITGGGLPAGGLSMTTGLNAGVISGVPTVSSAINFTVKVTDTSVPPQTVSPQFSITPASLVSILLSPANASISIGNTQSYAGLCNWSDGTAKSCTQFLNFFSSTTAATIGLTSGLATGVTAATSPTSITATFNGVTSNADTLVVVGPANALVVVTTTLPVNPAVIIGGTSYPAGTMNGQVGDPLFPYQLVATGGVPPYSWLVTAGLAGLTGEGMAVSPTGTFTGTPIAGGTFNWTVTVTDSTPITPLTATQAYSFVVATLSTDQISPLTPSIVQGQTLQFTLAGIYSDGSATDITNLPGASTTVATYVTGCRASNYTGTLIASLSCTPPTAIAAGQTIVVIESVGSAGAPQNANPTIPTDNLSNTYSVGNTATLFHNNTKKAASWIIKNALAGSTTFQGNWSATSKEDDLIVLVYAGASNTTQPDQHSELAATANPCTGASLVTTFALDTIINFCDLDGTGRSFTPKPGYTGRLTTADGSASTEDLNVSTTNTYPVNFQSYSGGQVDNIDMALAIEGTGSATGTIWSAVDLSNPGSGAASITQPPAGGLASGNNGSPAGKTSTIQGCVGATCSSTVLTVTAVATACLTVTPGTEASDSHCPNATLDGAATITIGQGPVQFRCFDGNTPPNEFTATATWSISNPGAASITNPGGLVTPISATATSATDGPGAFVVTCQH
jgi:hypothetical protein